MSIVNYSSELLGDISFDDEQFEIIKEGELGEGYLRYIGKTSLTQPIGLTKYCYMFINNTTNVLSLLDWNMSEAEDLEGMFYGCTSLELVLGLQYWDVSKVKSMNYMFYNCVSLLNLIDLIKDWDMSNVESIKCMFYGCTNLKEIIGIENWNLHNIKDMDNLFYCCKSLENKNIFEFRNYVRNIN